MPFDQDPAVPEETAKEWAARVHGLTFDEDRRRQSGLPPLAEYHGRLAAPKWIREQEEAQERENQEAFADWRATLTEVSLPGVAGAQLVIRYRDDPTERPIRVVHLMQGEHAHYLQCFCGLRDDHRMFRVAAITEVVTTDGEVFDSGYDWLNSLTGIS